MEFHGLLSEAFNLLGYDQENRVSELTSCLELLTGNRKKEDKELLKPLGVRLLKVFYGKAWDRGIDPSLIPALEKCGFTFSDNRETISGEQLDGIESQPQENISDLFGHEDFLRDIPKYIPEGPAFVVSRSKERPGELIIPHNNIISRLREERLGIIRDILTGNYVTEHTKKSIQEKSDSVGSNQEAVWRIAASEISYLLLKDFRYVRSLFDQFIQPSSAQMPQKIVTDLVNKAWAHVMTPNLATVIDDLPLLLQDLPEKIGVFWRIDSGFKEYLASSENPVPLRDFLDWYLSNVYFIPVAGPLNPWRLLTHVFGLSEDRQVSSSDPAKSRSSIASTEVLKHVQEWLKEKEDPLAHLLALDLILCARASATTEEEKSVFITGDFYEFLDDLLKKLLLAERRAPDYAKQKGTSERTKAIGAVWRMTVLLARYYLKYIDLIDQGNVMEEMRPVLAWWMARELGGSILGSLKHLGIQDRIAWIQKEVLPPLKRQNDSVVLSHLLTGRMKHVSPSRFRTLDENGIPLSVATLSMLMPHHSETADEITAYDGLIYPTKAIAPEIRDLILERLSLQAAMGEGQLQGDDDILPLLWDTPLCISVPSLLESYYGDDVSFLGEEKLNIIKAGQTCFPTRLTQQRAT